MSGPLEALGDIDGEARAMVRRVLWQAFLAGVEAGGGEVKMVGHVRVGSSAHLEAFDAWLAPTPMGGS